MRCVDGDLEATVSDTCRAYERDSCLLMNKIDDNIEPEQNVLAPVLSAFASVVPMVQSSSEIHHDSQTYSAHHPESPVAANDAQLLPQRQSPLLPILSPAIAQPPERFAQETPLEWDSDLISSQQINLAFPYGDRNIIETIKNYLNQSHFDTLLQQSIHLLYQRACETIKNQTLDRFNQACQDSESFSIDFSNFYSGHRRKR